MSESITSLLQLAPDAAARQLQQGATQAWLSDFLNTLEATQDPKDELKILMRSWNLSQAAAADLFGVSRQALSKWLSKGVPQNRLVDLANLSAATDLLRQHIKPQRIGAVVRRHADRLGGRSLYELAKSGHSAKVLAACREMFDFGAAQGH